MIPGINLMETLSFTSKYDITEPKTVWRYGIIDSEALPVVLESGGGTLSQMTELVRFGLRGFENFRDNSGKEIAFATEQVVLRGRVFQVLASSVLRQIPRQVILELGVKILELGKLTEPEIKN